MAGHRVGHAPRWADDRWRDGDVAKGWVCPSWEDAATGPLAASSAWNGAVVDYCYARMPATARAGGAVRLGGVEASYFYHTLASDHLPLVVDFAAVRAA